MNIANTILSGLSFAGGGDDEHTARVAQAQKNRAQQATLDAQNAQQLTQELYASGVDITSDGRGMSVGALEQLNSDMGRQRMVRLWNSQRAAQQWRDADGNIMSTEIVDFARGPDGTIIPMVKGHNGKVVPMTEMRSNSDSDKVLQLSEERFEQWSNELYTSNLARAGADFVLGGKLGEIDAARGSALATAGRNGAKNNAAIEGITEMTGGDPEATSAGLAIIADADEDGTSQILGEMGIDPATVGQDFTYAPVEAESLARPSGDPTATPAAEGGLPTAPSAKPSSVPSGVVADGVEQRGALIENLDANKARLEEVNAALKGMSAFDRNMPGGQAAALRREKAQLRKDIEQGEKIKRGTPQRDPVTGQVMEAGPDRLAGNNPDPEPLTDDKQLQKAGVPSDLLAPARNFIARFGITKESVELDEARRKAANSGDMVALDKLVGKHVEDIDPADIQAVLNNSSGPISPTQVREDIENDTQLGQDELDSARGALREAGIEDVRQLRQANLDTAMEAARVIAMMTEGTKTDKVNMYGGLVNYIQTGNFEMTPNDIAQTQIDAAKEARQQSELANAPGNDVLSTAGNVLKESRTQFTSGLYNSEKRGKRGREWAEPTGADKAAFDNIAIAMLDIEDAIGDGRLTQAKAKATQRRLLREASRYLAADFSNRDTSWFNLGGAMSDFWSNARTNGNPLERVVVSAWSDEEKTIPKNIRFVKPNGRYVDGELSYGNFTRSMDDSMSAAVMQIITDNTRRLRGN